jgi:hypothetical protein
MHYKRCIRNYSRTRFFYYEDCLDREGDKRMIQKIKEAISNKLLELYTDITIYDEEIPQEGENSPIVKPYFLITLTSQGYTKLLSNKSKVELAFDVTYYSNQSTGIKNDCIQVGQALLTNFESLQDYRALRKKVEVKENVMHFTFSLQYLEMKMETPIFMNKKEVKTNI